MQLKKKYSHRLSHLALVVSALAVGGCSSGGDDAVATTTPTTTPTSTTAVAGLKTVEQIDVVAADDSGATTYKLPRNFSKLGRAFNSPDTDYTTDEQHFHVWHPALEPIESVNSILCFIGQVEAQEFVNDGPFIALVDDNKCNSKGEGNSASTQGSQSSSSEDSLPSYVEVIADATRSSSSSPMEVKIWIPEMEMGDGGSDNSALIKAKVTVSEAPSDSKPFGDFRMAFDMSMNGTSIGGGDLASQVSGSQTGFTFYEGQDFGDGSAMRSASLLGNADGTTGVAMTHSEHSFGMMEQRGTFGLSFNADNVLGRKGETAAAIQSQPEGTGACLSRTEFDEAVWRYNLYNQATGERVTLNSGFPFKYTAEGEERFGYVGYWGVWAEGGDGLADGTEITKQTFGEGGATATDTYTVTTTPGKLIKYTANKAQLTELAGVQFHYWDEYLADEEYDQWVVEYIDGAFKYVGGITWSGMGPPEIDTFAPEDVEAIELDAGESLHLWSQQLGGSVVFRGGEEFIVYNTEEVLSSIPAELDGVDLVCYDRCTKSGLNSGDLAAWDGPYTSPFMESMGGSLTPVTYRMSAATMTLSKVVGDTPTAVTYPTGTIEANSHQWGIRSGHLIPKSVADTLDSPHEIYNPDAVAVFYEWEIGSNNWNKVVQVKDSNGTVQTFDKPIEFGYIHATANDRDDSSTFNGQRFLLSYQGDGQLHGIPFEAKVKDAEGKERAEGDAIDENNHHVRWYPQFNLKDGITLGGSSQYVVKAIDIEQMMQEGASGACAGLGASFTSSNLSLPTGLASTHTTDIASVGAIPTLSEEDAIPKVVGGEIQVEDEE